MCTIFLPRPGKRNGNLPPSSLVANQDPERSPDKGGAETRVRDQLVQSFRLDYRGPLFPAIYLHPLCFHFSTSVELLYPLVEWWQRARAGSPLGSPSPESPSALSRRGRCRDFGGACRPGTSRLSLLVLYVNQWAWSGQGVRLKK